MPLLKSNTLRTPALVLLKNEKIGNQTALQALGSADNILVTGSKADDIGAQCGGWTIVSVPST